MHGERTEMSRKTLHSSHIRVVENLHSVPPNVRSARGFSLVEALVALAVLGVAAAGVVAMGGAGRRLGEIAAVRTAQVLAAREAMEAIDGGRTWTATDTVQVGRRRLAVTIDTARIAPGLVEVRITVRASGTGGPHELVTRRADMQP
jgi:prepilin-type N-terminal cleavage/methylation domain-containing protein